MVAHAGVELWQLSGAEQRARFAPAKIKKQPVMNMNIGASDDWKLWLQLVQRCTSGEDRNEISLDTAVKLPAGSGLGPQ